MTGLARRLPRRARFAFAVAPAALLALPLVTRERTALPSSLWLALATGALLLAALRSPGPPRWRLDAPLAATLGLLASAAFLEPGLVLAHDTRHHVWGAWAYLQEWHAGNLWPIWLHQVGLGLPLPLFYGPLPFWWMAPVALAGGGPSQMLEASFVLAAIAAALGAWSAVAVWSGDRRAALVAAAAWSFAPYRLLVSSYRGSLGEAWALALAPFALVAFDRLLATRDRRWFAAAAAAVALVTVAHPLSLFLLLLVLPVFAVVRLARRREAGRARAARALHALGAAVAGLALAGFFVLPLGLESRHLNLGGIRGEAGAARYAGHFVRPAQLVRRALWSEARWSQPPHRERGGLADMPFYVGVVLLAGLAAATAAGARPVQPEEPPLLALAAVGWVSLALTLELPARWTAGLPSMMALQFPWRFLGPASAAAALGLALLLPRGDAPRGRLPFAAAALVALAVLADGFPFTGAVGRAAPWTGIARLGSQRNAAGVVQPERLAEPWPMRLKGAFLPPRRCCADVGETYWVYPEYFTPRARARVEGPSALASIGIFGFDHLERVDPLPYARLWREAAPRPRALGFRRGGGEIVVELPRRARGRVEVAEQYFPGWQVELGGRWREAGATDGGFLAAPVPAGARVLRFRFDRWRADRLAGWLVSLATAGMLGVAVGRQRADREPRCR